MSERFTAHGLDLSLAAVRKVLAWVDDPLRTCPRCVFVFEGSSPNVGDAEDVARPLTATLVAEMRDWATPWTEVDWDEIEVGEMLKPNHVADSREYVMGSGRVGAFGGERGYPVWVPRSVFGRVLVRRPRKPSLTLDDAPSGATVRSTEYPSQIATVTVSRDSLRPRTRAVLVGMRVEHWPDDTPVEIVEEPS